MALLFLFARIENLQTVLIDINDAKMKNVADSEG